MGFVDHTEMRLGKKAAKFDSRTLSHRMYAPKPLFTPSAVDVYLKVTDLGMMLNDTYGDCTCAAVGHQIQTWTAEAGTQVIIPDSAVLDLYEKACGYILGDDSTDQGGVEIDVLNYWKKNPINGHGLLAYTAVNYKSQQEIQEAIYYFGGAYIGVAMPCAWQTTDTWDVGTGSQYEPGGWGGHAVILAGYNSTGPIVCSWGKWLQMTWAACFTYLDESYALLSMDAFANGKTIEGFDLATLQTDLVYVGK